MIAPLDFSVYHLNGINFLPEFKDQFTELFLAHSELLILIGDSAHPDEELLAEINAVLRFTAELRAQSIPIPVLLGETSWVKDIPICTSLLTQILTEDIREEHATSVLLAVNINPAEILASGLLSPVQWSVVRENICCGALVNSMLLTALNSRKRTTGRR